MVPPEPVIGYPAEVKGGGMAGRVLLALDHQVARVVHFVPLPVCPATPWRMHTHVVLACQGWEGKCILNLREGYKENQLGIKLRRKDRTGDLEKKKLECFK